jgi:hypothetical protein
MNIKNTNYVKSEMKSEMNSEVKSDPKSITKRFSFKKLFSHIVSKDLNNKSNNIIITKLPNKNYINNIIKEEKCQTLNDIFVGLGWRGNENSEMNISNEIGFEIGKVINSALPRINPIKITVVNNNQIMKVRQYYWYEVPFVVCVIYTYFDLLDLIPDHWVYVFNEDTNLYNIVYNLFYANLNLNNDVKLKLQNILIEKDKHTLYSLENMLYEKCPFLVNKNVIVNGLNKIDAKYGLAIELFILNNLNNLRLL